MGMMLGLFACGKRKAAEETPNPPPSAPAELSEQDLGAVSALAKELSAKQMQMITDSIEITKGEAESGAVKVTLVSAMGDGCYNCFNVLVQLPEKDKAENGGYGFQSAELSFGDPEAPFKTTAREWRALDDDDPGDGRYTLRLTVGASRWDNREYILNNGITRSLTLKNIVSDDGEVLYKGEWSFDFVCLLSGEYIGLVSEPLAVPGVSETGKYGEKDWAEISSFVLSNFSAECRFKLKDSKAAEPFSYGLAYVEMQSGEKHLIGCDAGRVEGKTDIRDFYLVIPISLEEVKSIHLTDRITIDVA